MLKQRRSSRQPRTDTGSEGDGEPDAPPAPRDAFPLYRHYQSDLNNYYDTAKQVLDDELDEKLTLKRHVPTISSGQTFSGAYPGIDPRGRGRTRIQAQVPESDDEDEYERYRHERERKSHYSTRSEKDRRISLQAQSHHGVRGPRIQSGTYNPNGEDEYYDINHFGRPFNRTDNPTRTPSPLRYYSPHSSVQPGTVDIFGGRSGLGIEKAELAYDVNTRNLGQPNPPSKPSQTPPTYGDYASHSRVYEKVVEASIRPMSIGMSNEKLVKWRAWIRADAQLATESFTHEQAKAEYREGPGGRLREMRSFSNLYSNDTISRDSTIGNEARMDDLLACVGNKMMKAPSLKEPRGEGLRDGERLGGHTRNEYQEVEDGYQSRSNRIESTSDNAAMQQFSPSPSPSTDPWESDDEYEDDERTSSPRPTWTDMNPSRSLTMDLHVDYRNISK
ncbi:uncharacterized protein FMAN_08436 [Fusarium mangiferae]|uniref:Uncharacterized protein n=1 Tax=Fusarium mangiferae TaxID=192010 RepID=A0A1L7TPP9_FUSMA|nr:uncharacterized protein FMAN_08436 [Fusarium mangiferae]CVK98792.1 uncharacterized protein FMAN_08436 [Fusarium mangiferae]